MGTTYKLLASLKGGTSSVSFAEDSWETINSISTSGLASTTYNIGDEKTISVGGTDYVIQIIGFNHDTLSDGSGTGGITCQFKNCLATGHSMNGDYTNAGGWDQCEMRTYLSDTVLPTLPSDLQAVLKTVDKKTSAGSTSSTITTSADKLFLLSHIEIMGTINWITTGQATFAGEGTQYEYYKNATIPSGFTALSGSTGTFYRTSSSSYTNRFGESKSTSSNLYYNYNNAKGYGDSATSATWWWTRSPWYSNSDGFANVITSGNVYYDIADISNGVAPAFCV